VVRNSLINADAPHPLRDPKESAKVERVQSPSGLSGFAAPVVLDYLSPDKDLKVIGVDPFYGYGDLKDSLFG